MKSGLLCLASLVVFVPAGMAMPELDFQVPDVPVERKPAALVVDLDLSSGRECVPASLAFEGENYKNNVVVVNEGANIRTIKRESMLTAGEYFAAKQVMRGQTQKLSLCSRGTATSGLFELDAHTARHCRNLNVGSNLTMLHDTTKIERLTIPGEMTIRGRYVLLGDGNRCSVLARTIHLHNDGAIEIEELPGSPSNIAVVTLKAQEITFGDTGSSRAGWRAERKAAKKVGNRHYSLQKVERVLPRNEDDLIDISGTDEVEQDIERQQRETCQPRR